MRVNAGLNEAKTKLITDTLGKLLADTHLLYIKTLNYHWNIEDPRFSALHKLLEEQYETLSGYLDAFAERIRMLGHKAPATLKEWSGLTNLKEGDSNFSGDQMIEDLAKDHETVNVVLRDAIRSAEQAGDPGTADLLIEALRDHEKAAWFLRAHL